MVRGLTKARSTVVFPQSLPIAVSIRRCQQSLAVMSMYCYQAHRYRWLRRLEQLSPIEFELQDHRSRSQIDRTARLVEHLQPLSGPDRMLPQALMKGPLAQALAHHDIPLRVRYYGGVSALSYDLHVAFYRLICDGIAYLCERDHLAEIIVCLRCRQRNGRPRIMLRVVGKAAPSQSRLPMRKELLCQLRQLSRGEGFQPIQDGAMTFGGVARQRVRGEWPSPVDAGSAATAKPGSPKTATMPKARARRERLRNMTVPLIGGGARIGAPAEHPVRNVMAS